MHPRSYAVLWEGPLLAPYVSFTAGEDGSYVPFQIMSYKVEYLMSLEGVGQGRIICVLFPLVSTPLLSWGFQH